MTKTLPLKLIALLFIFLLEVVLLFINLFDPFVSVRDDILKILNLFSKTLYLASLHGFLLTHRLQVSLFLKVDHLLNKCLAYLFKGLQI